jgi:hypothetical protein
VCRTAVDPVRLPVPLMSGVNRPGLVTALAIGFQPGGVGLSASVEGCFELDGGHEDPGIAAFAGR